MLRSRGEAPWLWRALRCPYISLNGRAAHSGLALHPRLSGKHSPIAERLESAGLRPNVVRSNANYVVYIVTADLLKLAEKDEAVRRAVALYLAEKAKNGTPRQREIAEKLLKTSPFFSQYLFVSSKLTPL
jgi:hypothetical protein